MFTNTQEVKKEKVEAQIDLHSGDRILGAFFIRPAQKLSDLLNDERAFIPIETSDGLVMILSKIEIGRVTPLDQHVKQDSVQDPHDILGIPHTVSDEELREAYLRKAQSHHPDRIQAADLPLEFIDFANAQMSRINEAYVRIRAIRENLAEQEEHRMPQRKMAV